MEGVAGSLGVWPDHARAAALHASTSGDVADPTQHGLRDHTVSGPRRRIVSPLRGRGVSKGGGPVRLVVVTNHSTATSIVSACARGVGGSCWLGSPLPPDGGAPVWGAGGITAYTREASRDGRLVHTSRQRQRCGVPARGWRAYVTSGVTPSWARGCRTAVAPRLCLSWKGIGPGGATPCDSPGLVDHLEGFDMRDRNTNTSFDWHTDSGEWEIETPEGYAAGRPLLMPQSWHRQIVDDERERAS